MEMWWTPDQIDSSLIVVIRPRPVVRTSHICSITESQSFFFRTRGLYTSGTQSPGPIVCALSLSSSSSYFLFLSLLFCTARQDYNVGGERVRVRRERGWKRGSIFWYHGVRQLIEDPLSSGCWNLFWKRPFHIDTIPTLPPPLVLQSNNVQCNTLYTSWISLPEKERKNCLKKELVLIV